MESVGQLEESFKVLFMKMYKNLKKSNSNKYTVKKCFLCWKWQ